MPAQTVDEDWTIVLRAFATVIRRMSGQVLKLETSRYAEAHMDPADAERDHLAKVWRQRAQQYGERCVLNLAHGPEGYRAEDARQKSLVYPWLRQALNGKEQTVLDFGCGAGRFTGDLFALVNRGAAVGFDVSEDLLTIARGSVDRATFIGDYSVLSSDQYAEYFDVIVVLTVIGGFSDALCVETASLLTTRLKPEGLLFLAENTAEDIRGNGFWTLRPVSWYQELFREVDLNVASKYWDLGAEVSIMTGRKKAIGSSTTR